MFLLGAFLASALMNLHIFSFLRIDLPFLILVGIKFFLLCVCIAWILTPASLRLIADQPSKSVPREKKTQGRIAAIIVAAVTIIISHYISGATPSINFAFEADVLLRRLVIWPAFTILSDLPLGLLWVTLSLLAHEDLQMPEIPSPS